MTAMQTLCMRQSHVGRQDERMELMKGMVTEAMEAPMKQNAADVKTRCLRSDVENMNKEVQQLTESLEKGVYIDYYIDYYYIHHCHHH